MHTLQWLPAKCNHYIFSCVCSFCFQENGKIFECHHFHVQLCLRGLAVINTRWPYLSLVVLLKCKLALLDLFTGKFTLLAIFKRSWSSLKKIELHDRLKNSRKFEFSSKNIILHKKLKKKENRWSTGVFPPPGSSYTT